MLSLDSWWSRVEMIAIEIGLCDMFAFPLTVWLSILIVSIGDCILNVRIPLKLACRKQQDVVKGRIEWMDICDALEGRAIPAVENDVMCALWLITISWKNDGDRITSRV
jgi:hypothetical protein